MSLRQHAYRHARAGRRVFPLLQSAKLPAIDDFPNRATTDPAVIDAWWFDDVLGLEHPLNVGISTNGLLVIDVDNKDGRNGDESLLRLELSGLDLPETYEQQTPSGGRHIVYSTAVEVANSVQKLGPGLDVRGRGGFIVASGSVVAKGSYTDNGKPVAPAPQALIDLCGISVERAPDTAAPANVDEDHALKRFTDYLKTAPRSVKGDGGDACAYQVACRGRDYGLSEAATLDAMLGPEWDDGCGWSHDKLAAKVKHAYAYAKAPAGHKAPETEFSPVPEIETPKPAKAKKEREKPKPEPENHESGVAVESLPGDENHPVNKFNRNHAFVLVGSTHMVLWETTDYKGRFDLRFIEEPTFHRIHTAVKIPVESAKGPAMIAASKLWMDSPARTEPPSAERGEPALWRRSYRGVVFDPRGNPPEGYYNVWRGFAYEPWPAGEPAPNEWHWALDAWVEHLLENVCGGNAHQARWLTGWLAHAVQRPWEKPLVAVVMHGAKGVGKTTIAERFCALLGSHGLVTKDRRYLTSNFNGHMERLLALVLDEALWAGDKAGEGVLKGLITSNEHLIERKSKEAYRVDNYARIIIIGNERWLVPASNDERRFAVFNVGDGRKQQNEWFQRMREGFEAGGYRLLLRYLLDFDLTGVDLNRAPSTEGLLQQKEESLEPFCQWWLECLQDGRIAQADSPSSQWPEQIGCDEIPHALSRYFKARNISSRLPGPVAIGRELRRLCPSLKRQRLSAGYVYNLPPLVDAREEWSRFIGHFVNWN